jgi:hypothetical protein
MGFLYKWDSLQLKSLFSLQCLINVYVILRKKKCQRHISIYNRYTELKFTSIASRVFQHVSLHGLNIPLKLPFKASILIDRFIFNTS